MDTSYFDEKRRAIPYPKGISKPYLKSNPTSVEARTYAEALEEYENNKPILKTLIKDYYEKCAEVEEEFKMALFEDLGISDNPKKELLYSKAYDSGHSRAILKYITMLVTLWI